MPHFATKRHIAKTGIALIWGNQILFCRRSTLSEEICAKFMYANKRTSTKFCGI